MDKQTYIEKFGIEAYQRKLERSRKWKKQNREKAKAACKACYEENREKYIAAAKACYKRHRKKGKTSYCTENYDCVPGYQEALAHNFEGYTQHHRLEDAFTSYTLIQNGIYQNVGPFNLQWLPKREHEHDGKVSIKRPEKSVWHKHMYQDLSNRNAELHIAELTEQPISDPKIQTLLDEYVHKPLKFQED